MGIHEGRAPGGPGSAEETAGSIYGPSVADLDFPVCGCGGMLGGDAFMRTGYGEHGEIKIGDPMRL